MNNYDDIGDALALTVPCPLCGAQEFEPCVYVWPKGVRPCHMPEGLDYCIQHNADQHKRLDKVGTPTKVIHNARKNLVYTRKIRDRQLAELGQLGDWLHKYGDIFREGGTG